MDQCPISWGEYDQMIENQPQEDLDNPNIDYDVRVSEYINELGQRVRKRQLVKLTKIIKTVPRSVWERQQRMKPFGEAADCTSLENSQKTTISSDHVAITLKIPNKSKKQLDVDQDYTPLISDGIKCRRCGGNHWTSRCNNSDPTSSPPPSENYIPPSSRRPGLNDEDDCKIRITNLPEEATREDIENLVAEVGHARRINLVRDRHTRESRGFAFVSFTRLEDVERAIEILNGRRYHHMILTVDQARR